LRHAAIIRWGIKTFFPLNTNNVISCVIYLLDTVSFFYWSAVSSPLRNLMMSEKEEQKEEEEKKKKRKKKKVRIQRNTSILLGPT
jgi:hypothetical protein